MNSGFSIDMVFYDRQYRRHIVLIRTPWDDTVIIEAGQDIDGYKYHIVGDGERKQKILRYVYGSSI